MPSQPATSSRAFCAFCVEHHRVTRPSSPQTAAAARVSSGAGGQPLVDDLPRDHDLAVVEQVLVERPCRSRSRRDVLVPASANSSTSSAAAASQVDHGRQRVVVDLHQVGGVLALVGLLGEDGGDRLADEPHLVGGQERPDHRPRWPPANSSAGARSMSAPVNTATTPGADRASSTSIAVIRRVRERGPDEREVQRTGQPVVGQVVGVAWRPARGTPGPRRGRRACP